MLFETSMTEPQKLLQAEGHSRREQTFVNIDADPPIRRQEKPRAGETSAIAGSNLGGSHPPTWCSMDLADVRQHEEK